jgi:ribosomal protein S17
MSKNVLVALAGTTLLLCFSVAHAMQPSNQFQVGDKASYAYKNRSRSATVTFEVVAVNGAQVTMTETRGSKTGDRVFVSDQGGFSKSLCWAVDEQCTFSSPNVMVAFPLEKGKKWTNAQSATGETWKGELEKKHKVGRLEKVKVPTGEFEAFRIEFSGKVTGKTNSGQRFKMSEKAKYWYALVNGKPVMVKFEYSSSNKDKVSMELTQLRFQ